MKLATKTAGSALFWLIFAAAAFLWASAVFGQAQTEQDVAKAFNSSVPDVWKAAEAGVTGTAITIQAGDSIWTDPFYTMPYMDVQNTTADTGSVDSVAYKVEFWQSMTKAGTYHYVKTLDWCDASKSSAYVQTIDAAGSWACEVGRSRYYKYPYCKLLIVALSGCKVLTGLTAEFHFIGFPLGGQ